jgi:2-keto-3-deoxy-L-rhamnonate aldolase RhmA
VWVKIPSIEVVEVIASSGLAFLVIDREHGAIDVPTMAHMIAVARGLGLPAFVRVPSSTAAEVQPALDAGAAGVFIPHVDDADAARALIATCRFPPIGQRHGSPSTRAGDWGALTVEQLTRRGNDEVMLVAQIETPRAVGNIADIVATPGLDAVFVGPFDLSLSSGLESNDPAFEALVANVEHAAIPRIALGGVPASDRTMQDLEAAGYAFFMIGADITMLGAALRDASRWSGK